MLVQYKDFNGLMPQLAVYQTNKKMYTQKFAWVNTKSSDDKMNRNTTCKVFENTYHLHNYNSLKMMTYIFI